MVSYFRSYELTIEPKAGEPVQFVQDRSQQGLAIEFNIQKSDTEQSNPATVKIFNPSNDTISKIQSGEILRLKAGYHNDISTILIGRITSFFVSVNGMDVVVEIEVETRPPVKLSINEKMSKGSTNIQIIDKLVTYIIDNVAEVEGKNPYVIPTVQSYKSSVVLAGDPYELLLKYLVPIGYLYVVDNGIISILQTDGFLLESAVNLSPSSGLIGSPKKIQESIKGTDKKRNGIEVKSILNYNFAPRKILVLQSREVTGRYTISTVTFQGNSFSGEWTATVRCFT
jgi:hypothetical protein